MSRRGAWSTCRVRPRMTSTCFSPADLRRSARWPCSRSNLAMGRNSPGRRRSAGLEGRRWLRLAFALLFSLFPVSGELAARVESPRDAATTTDGSLAALRDEVKQLEEQAGILMMRGRSEEARPLLERALPLAENRFGREDLQTTRVILALGEVRVRSGSSCAASTLLERGVSAIKGLSSGYTVSLAPAARLLAIAQQDCGDLAGAETTLRELVDAENTWLGPVHPVLHEDVSLLAAILGERIELEMQESLLIEYLGRWRAA